MVIKPIIAPATDSIHMPDERLFDGRDEQQRADDWYSVVFHEATHATGVEKRCHRELGKRFGDDAYSMEELVAELGSAMLMAHLGFSALPRADHAQYIAHWPGVLKADKKSRLYRRGPRPGSGRLLARAPSHRMRAISNAASLTSARRRSFLISFASNGRYGQ